MLEIDCDFPGGNIRVDAIDDDTVRLRPDLRDTEGEWFYWYFRVSGAAGRTLRFVFDREVVGVRGPGVSLDCGRSWEWMGRDSADDTGFTYSFPPTESEVRFSFGMPYTQSDLDAFLGAHAGNPYLRAGVLCESRKGRAVECLWLGRPEGEPEHRVLIAARHHACEMMASYALEGIVEAIISGDCGRWLRDKVELLVVPFVDKDGVEDGDQGKNRRPHDHGRDYAAPCIYPEVRALRELTQAWSAGKMRLAFDLHCPWIRGDTNEHIYFVGMPCKETWDRVELFSARLEALRRGPLPYRACSNLPFGQGWNTETDPPGAEPRTFSRWMAAIPGVWCGVTLEIPYANAQGAAVTPQTARAFGQDLAAAIGDQLAALPG
jgi:hypothetical protein